MQIPRWLLALAGTGFPLAMAAANWPNWRGPNADGSTSESGFVISWDRTNQVVWRVPLPEPGNSSPIIWGNRVFVTQAQGNRRTVICVDRVTGKMRWQSGPAYDLPEETMKESNPYCSASPVTDGERVIAFFGSAGLHCLDYDGRELWKTDLGPISHPFGTASSPCLWSNSCFVYVGPGEKQTMAAIDKRDGKVIWRAEALVLAAEPKFKVLSTNSVSEPTNASLALAQGSVVMRTDQALWCFGAPPKEI